MAYGERNRGEMCPHNKMKWWAYEEKALGNYLKARKIFKVALAMQERYWLDKGRSKLE
jgi:hypothetical protein